MTRRAPEQDFGERLKRLMRERRESGRSLAAAIGVHETTVSGWVNGRMRPEYDRLRSLAEHFAVSERWLSDGESEGSPPHQDATVTQPAQTRGPESSLRDSGAFASPDARVWMGRSREIESLMRYVLERQKELNAELVVLEAAADARRQAGQLFDVPAEIAHEGNDEEVARLNLAISGMVDPSAGEARETTPRRKKRSAG